MEVEAGTQAAAREQKSWEKAASWPTQSNLHSASFLMQIRTSDLGNGTAHSGLVPPASVSNQGNLSQSFTQANLICTRAQ